MEDVGHVLLSEVILDSATAGRQIEALVQEHARFIYRLTYSILRNHHDAEDATQETFVRVLRHQRELPGVRDPRLWLAKIARRVAIDRRRKQQPASLDESAEHQMDVPSIDPGVEQELIREQRLAFLDRAITSLPAELRDVVTLSMVEELSGVEIAALLDIPEVSVRTRMFRARQILKEKLLALMKG